ncbi:MAG: hypothetical protein HQL72_07625 [Magnetococcales bacterium]|nr:hypothetical protein [Magnetococcales bacterium]
MSRVKASVCWHCKEVLSPDLGRGSICSGCKKDSRVCLNCRFYDAHSYNECHESQAERVMNKENGNFCDYFSINKASVSSSRKQSRKRPTSKTAALQAAEALFK